MADTFFKENYNGQHSPHWHSLYKLQHSPLPDICQVHITLYQITAPPRRWLKHDFQWFSGSASSASREGSQSRQMQLPKKTSSDLLSGDQASLLWFDGNVVASNVSIVRLPRIIFAQCPQQVRTSTFAPDFIFHFSLIHHNEVAYNFVFQIQSNPESCPLVPETGSQWKDSSQLRWILIK